MIRAIAFLLPLLCFGCANVDPGPLPVDAAKLGNVIADLQLAEAISSEVPVVLRDTMSGIYYDSVLAEHGYTRAEFDSIMWIIRQQPVWIDSIYTRAGEIVAREMIEE